jgi:DHA2 family multidrug resistance protein-like MFS transporter
MTPDQEYRNPANTIAQPRATRREWAGLAVLCLACLLYVMDLTVLHLAVPRISEDLKPTGTQLLWMIDIYGFLVAGTLITMGTLGDRIGRRKLLLIGAAAFGTTSLLAAFSTSPEMLIASRALMGIAGATLAPSTLSLIFNMFMDERQRSVAIGVWISSFSAGSAVGPLLGGLLLQYFWWGSVFLLALPVMAALLLLGPRLLPEFRAPQAGRLDLLSAGMSLVAVLAVIFGLTQIAQDGFSAVPSGVVLGGLAVGAMFVRRQLTLADPLIDLSLFRIPAFSASLATNVLGIFVAVGYFLFIAQYMQLVLGLSPLEAGLWSLPSALAFILASNVTPHIKAHVRPAVIMGSGLVLAALALSMLLLVGAGDAGSNSLAMLVAASVVISLGFAPVISLTTELIVGSAPPERAGAASGISETAAELGGALGIAILGSIGIAVYRSQLASNLPAGVPAEAAEVARGTLGGAVGVARQLPGQTGQALLEVARGAFVSGLHVAAAISAGVAVIAAIITVVALRHLPAGAQHEGAQDFDGSEAALLQFSEEEADNVA